ncbi:dodecenoyl-CoA isomerase [Elasticomyces elasticus]|nr:dodecenoyl-CoA isomerase [Elasticomyces elasticus]
MADVVSVKYNGRVAVVTIDRPKKLNALTKDGFFELSKCLREIDKVDEVVITIIVGKGRFFSAGADVSTDRNTPAGLDPWRHALKDTTSSIFNITQAFYTHSKILVTALNGPVVGLTSALVSFSDFIYCMPHTYLLAPFTSLGLVAEGGSSLGFIRRMGVAKANEALIASRKIPADELLSCGYVNEIFDCAVGQEGPFLDMVLQRVEDLLGPHLVASSMLKTKALMLQPMRDQIDKQIVAELFTGLDRSARGIPQVEFAKIKSGAKRHKL